MRLETLGALAAFAAAVLTVEQRGAASTFGLVLSYALTITQLTSITVRPCPGAGSASGMAGSLCRAWLVLHMVELHGVGCSRSSCMQREHMPATCQHVP